LRHLVNEGMGANTPRAPTSDVVTAFVFCGRRRSEIAALRGEHLADEVPIAVEGLTSSPRLPSISGGQRPAAHNKNRSSIAQAALSRR
jgi:hypothetical protein